MTTQAVDDGTEDKRTTAAGRQQNKAAAMAMEEQDVPQKGPSVQRGWHGETAPGHDRGTGNQSPRLGIDAGSEFLCGLKFGEGNEDVRQITRDEQQWEGKQGGRCEEEQELAARQRGSNKRWSDETSGE